MVEIKHISEEKSYIEVVAKWLWKEWGTEGNYEFFRSIIGHSIEKNNLPQTFVAAIKGKPVGTVGIWRCDMVSRQDLYPWLSALYILPEYRNRGIGRLLQEHLVSYTKELGYENIYLYTDIEGYYEKGGWELIDRGITYSGEYDRIYSRKL